MGLSYRPMGQKNNDPHHLGGGNPDDDRPELIGKPQDAEKNPYAHWKKTGRITGREFSRDVMGSLRRGGMSVRKRAIIEAAEVGFGDRDHGTTGLDVTEAKEFVEDIREEANKLGFSQRDVEKLEAAVGEAINE